MPARALLFLFVAATGTMACSSGSDTKLSSGSGLGGGSSDSTSNSSGSGVVCTASNDSVFEVPKGACLSCAEKSCDSEFTKAVGSKWASGAVNGGACGGYVSCFGKCCGDQACELKCPMPTSACNDALDAITACEADHCASPCNASTASGGANVDVTCFVDAQNQCTEKMVSGGGAKSFEQGCKDEGGTVSDKCPSANLTGCCTGATRVVCSYNAKASDEEKACNQTGGKWSTSL